MRIAVVGAGAIGCMLGARLSARGHQISLIGRQDQVDAIQASGLTVREPDGSERRAWLTAGTQLEERPELVLLTVKTQQVVEACLAIRSHVRQVPVVALQNGVRADALAAQVLGRDVVLGGVVMAAADYLQPGHVSVLFPGWMIVGEPFDGGPGRARALAKLLGDALPTYVTSNLAGTRWSKLVSNLNNALCAATGLTLPEVARSPLGRSASVHLMREGACVARAASIDLDHSPYGLSWRGLWRDRNTALIASLQAFMSTALVRLPEPAAEALVGAASRSRLGRLPLRGSTWQSIARNKPSEIDFLNGEIVGVGGQYGVETPYNAHIVGLVRRVERTHRYFRIEDLIPSDSDEVAPSSVTVGAP